MKSSTQLKALIRNLFEYIQMIESSEILLNLWERYRSKNEYASDINWIDALNSMKKAFNKIDLS